MYKIYSVATGNKQTTLAATEVLDQGGNAYDALLAALFMSFVSEPLLSSPGGGGYLLAHPQGRTAQIFDFFAQTPINKYREDKDFYPILGDFGATTQEFHIGMAAAATPGIPAGIFSIHNHYGTMPLSELAWQAIDLAKKGAFVDKLCAQVLNILSPIILSSCHAQALYTNQQKNLLIEGERKSNPYLASFLYELSRNPMDWFYFDSPADTIVNDMHHNGGLLTKNDFEQYQVDIRAPLQTNFKGWNILTNAKPTTGGALIVEQLRHAEQNIKQASAQRTLDAIAYANTLKSNQTMQSSKGTTHMSVIDAQGNIASLTVSNGEGCGYIVPNSGFMLNNFLGEEDINAGGFFNFLENTKMASMMSPTILENAENKIALGTGGSNRIKTAMFQVIWNIISENKSLDQAINQARIHVENNCIDVEHGFDLHGFSTNDTPFNIKQWNNKSLYFGGINAVQQGRLNLAIGDARRNGVAVVNCLQ